MGIPVYFKRLIDDYDNILIRDIYFNTYSIDYLFLDLNCAIHPCCQKVIKKHSDNIECIENDMIESVINKINELIKLVNPKYVYIAIDGVAPRAKMEQQRTRRYKTTLEPKKIWNTNAITPGTLFMKKLNIQLDKTFNKKNIIISNSDEPGEGEHKILNYIKNIDPQHSVIYGLDADLIMLSLLSGRNIKLLREKTEYNFENIDSDYLYLDIDILKTHIIKDINKKNIIKISDTNIINDYIFLCFLLGNDFVKHIFSLNIRYNGLEQLLIEYTNIQKEFNGLFRLINDDKNIIKQNLIVLFSKLLINETMRLNKIKNIRHKQYQYNIKYTKHKNEPDYIRNIPLLENTEEKWVNIGETDWEERYYTLHMLGCKYNNKGYIDNKKNNICKSYIESLYWTTQYYFKGIVIWDWYYPYNYSPLLTDLLDYLHNNDIVFNPISKPYKAIEQLIIVLPPQSQYLIPIENIDLKIKKMYKTYLFPKTFEMDYVFKRYWWEAHPILPMFEEDILNKLLEG